MSFTDVILGRDRDNADIGGFDQNEADDLKLHVRQCARRYSALKGDMRLVIRLMFILILLEVLGVQRAAGILWTLLAKVAS